MADSQPVLISYLKLPPDEQPFFRIREILLLYRDKLETLTFAVASTQDLDGFEPLAPEYNELLKPLRKLGRAQCRTACEIVEEVRTVARVFGQVLHTLPIPSDVEKMPHIVVHFLFTMKRAAEQWEEAQQGVEQFSKEIVVTVGKITALLNKDPTKAPAAASLSENHSDTVDELIQATQECRAIYRRMSEFLRDTENKFQGDYFKGKLVSPDEIDMVRRRWTGLGISLDTLTDTIFSAIAIDISSGPSITRAKIMGGFWKSSGTGRAGSSTRSNTSTGPKAILALNVNSLQLRQHPHAHLALSAILTMFQGSHGFIVSGQLIDHSQRDQRTFISQPQNVHIHPTDSQPGSGNGANTGFDDLRRAAIRQAISDSSECASLKPACFPGTREEHIRNITSWGKGEWKSTQNARVLWLNGPAGVGKSALAQSCAQEIGKDLVAATFFFSRLNRWNRSEAFLPTICYQLATRSQAYRSLVSDIIARDPFVLNKSIPVQFQELLVMPLVELRTNDLCIFKNHLVIIDGLDEADDVEAQRIIVQTILSSVRQQTTPFLWAIFSRPEPNIQTAFSSKCNEGDGRVVWELLLPVSTDANEDIRLYLEDGFKMIRAQYQFHPSLEWPPKKAIDQLVCQSAGLFAYTSNVIRYIGGDGTKQFGLEERLNTVLSLGPTTRTNGSDNPFVHLDALYILMKNIPADVLPTTLTLLCIHLTHPWDWDNQLLMYSSILGLSLPDFYAAVHNLYSVLSVTKSPSSIPFQFIFYHASFGEFLQGTERSTAKFSINTSDVYQRCVAAFAATLNRLSRYHDIGELEGALSWPPISHLRPRWGKSHGQDLFVMAAQFLFMFSELIDFELPILRLLSSVNWKFGILTRSLATTSEAETFFRRIPEEWHSRIIHRAHRNFFDVLRHFFSDLKKGKWTRIEIIESRNILEAELASILHA
ncbi:hypothetical protein AN958_02502 [Leucoagaricus sp. SymC.cos]|nr:hypothetical protein AN958_02502 [Leucoagaricus sp. SymC.cos]